MESMGGAAVPGVASAEMSTWEKSQFSASASDAFGRAASNAGGKAVNTLHLFLALEGADVKCQWERLWLETGDLTFLASLDVEDPEPEADRRWDGAPLTRTCTAALDAALRISRSYDLGPVPIGALALGLVADPGSAAAQALTGSGMRHPTLIELLQELTFNARMDGLDELLGKIRRSSSGSSPAQPEIMPDDGGLRHRIASAAAPGNAGAPMHVRALCGRTWIPPTPERTQSPPEIPCPECEEVFDSMPERLQARTHEFNWSPIETSRVLPFKEARSSYPIETRRSVVEPEEGSVRCCA
jgi:hypothetical protein